MEDIDEGPHPQKKVANAGSAPKKSSNVSL